MFSWAELFLPWSSLDTVGLSEISVLGMWLLCPHQHMAPYLWQNSPYSPQKGKLWIQTCRSLSATLSPFCLLCFFFSKPSAWEVPYWAEESIDHCSGDVDSACHCLLTHKEVWRARAISNFPRHSCRSVDRHGEWSRNCWSGNGLFCYS